MIVSVQSAIPIGHNFNFCWVFVKSLVLTLHKTANFVLCVKKLYSVGFPTDSYDAQQIYAAIEINQYISLLRKQNEVNRSPHSPLEFKQNKSKTP